MSRVAKRLYADDETFREVADLLFGGGADELISKMSPEKKQKQQRVKDNIALATNTGGAIAGPAAIYGAYKNRKKGGFFRDVGRSGKVGPRAKKFAQHLDSPGGSKKMKAAAITAGGTMVGLQGLNMAGDTIAAQTFADKKKQEKVGKGYISKMEPSGPDLHMNKGKLQRITAEKIAESSRVSNLKAKGKSHIKEKVGKSVTWEGEISKVDTDKRQVFGWASIVEMDGQPVVDLQGDYIDIDEIEKSAYSYVIKSRKGGDMHRRNGEEPFHASDMIESFLVTPEKKEKMGLPDSTPTGWWVGYQINDDDAWNLVKSGKRTGFSIHGRGQRTPMEI